jgi:beta-galactosidase
MRPDKGASLFNPARRQFIQSVSFSAIGAMLSARLGSGQEHVEGGADAKGGEQIVRLDRGWRFRRGSAAAIQEVSKTDSQDWEIVDLPHCFNAMNECDPDEDYYRGGGWYRTNVAVRNPFAAGRTILHFQGAGQKTSLWIDDTLIGTHNGGYDEFAFDITDAVAGSSLEKQQHLPITLLCDNSPDHDRIPSELSDFCLYGGLYRHVNLVYLPEVALDAVHVLPTMAPDGSAKISVKAKLYNPAQRNSSCSVSVEIFDPSGQSVHRSSNRIETWNGFATISEFSVESPQLWSPDSPALYRCRATLVSKPGQASVEERFGIRRTEFVERGAFYLNGKRTMLRGTQRHADHAGQAAAMSDEQVRKEMLLIRQMGANFIRLAHYQQDRLVLDLCDELGLMVWEEMPWCRCGVGSKTFQENTRDALTHMIEQHYNHPSVIFWGLGNEDDWPTEYPSMNVDAIRAFMTEMRDLAHQLDSSRLTALRRCDFARDIPDVYSPSIWAGWYRGQYREYEQTLLEERARVNRFIHIEWGADSHAGRHSEEPEAAVHLVAKGQGTDERGLESLKTGGDPRMSSNGDWSETYACLLFDWHLKTQEKLEWLSGSAQWVFKDFASPLRDDNPVPRINQKGVVERDLTLKESYYVFQSYWTEKPMVHIYGHTWPIRWGKEGEQRPVYVYSNCERVELIVNGNPLGIKARNSQDFPAAGLRWDVSFKPGHNHLQARAFKDGTTSSDEINLTYQTENWGVPAAVQLTEKLRTGNRITVEARLVDAKGIPCLDAQDFVRFAIDGGGRLIDNLGTVRGSRYLQFANGRAQISLETDGNCTVHAAVDHVPPVGFQLAVGPDSTFNSKREQPDVFPR